MKLKIMLLLYVFFTKNRYWKIILRLDLKDIVKRESQKKNHMKLQHLQKKLNKHFQKI